MSQPLATRPLWLDHSGIPEHLATVNRGGTAWSIFCKIVELDCTRFEPAVVEIPIAQLAARCAMQMPTALKSISTLRREKLIRAFIADDPEEPSIFEICQPIKPRRPFREIINAHPQLATCPITTWRYLNATAREPEDRILHEVTDLYFNTCGQRMNIYVLDRIKQIAARHPIEQIRREFNRARENEIRSLTKIEQALSATRKETSHSGS